MSNFHRKCVCPAGEPHSPVLYPGSGVCRLPIDVVRASRGKIRPGVDVAIYNPPFYTAPHIMGRGREGLGRPVWADPPTHDEGDGSESIVEDHDEVGRAIARGSWMGDYKMVRTRVEYRGLEDGEPGGAVYLAVPANPIGATGIAGRGLLGRWGPNHAADPLVTRWKPDAPADSAGRRVLQVLTVTRGGESGTGEQALPGGMKDAYEPVTATVKREFCEEALAKYYKSEALEGRGADADKAAKVREDVERLFTVDDVDTDERVIYKGYVDDPRNTDNAWMETVCFHFHDEDGTGVSKFEFDAGSDATAVQWTDVSRDMQLYASHRDFVRLAAERVGAHW